MYTNTDEIEIFSHACAEYMFIIFVIKPFRIQQVDSYNAHEAVHPALLSKETKYAFLRNV